MSALSPLEGPRFEIDITDERYPRSFGEVRNPPERLYVMGSLEAIQEGLAIIGARKATPYGLDATARFARMAAEAGIPIISGGARGCDSASHRAALEVGGITIAVLGGGIDELYPKENRQLFQQIIDGGGAVISEHAWDVAPRPYYFRARNRIIAGASKATLIIEAGMPSGTFSTADEALGSGKAVLAVPGSINSRASLGANMLIYQGATPVVDEGTFEDQLRALFDIDRAVAQKRITEVERIGPGTETLMNALRSEALTLDELLPIAKRCSGDETPLNWLLKTISKLQQKGLVARGADGRYLSHL